MDRTQVIGNRGRGLLLALGIALSTATAYAADVVWTPPTITSEPQSQTVTEGENASFVVGVTGTFPMTFSWYFNSSLLTTTDNNQLNLVGVRFSKAGTYSVVVSNPGGSDGSTDAILTVIPAPVVTGDLVVHLSFDGHFNDISGRGNHGTAVGAPNLVPGLLGSSALNAFSTTTANHFVSLGSPADLDFGTGTDFSIAFWARLPQGSWTGGNKTRTPVFISNKDCRKTSDRGWAFATASDGRLQWNYTESSGPSRDYDGPAGTFGNPSWHHIAVTFQRGDSACTYVDGLLVDTRTLGSSSASLDAGFPVNIGNDGTGNYPLADGYWTNPNGVGADGMGLDDLGIWQRVLANQEIIAIYNAGLVGRDLASATLADAIGGLPARITQQPVAQDAVAGVDVTFSVGAVGSAPLAYQWRKDGTPIAGATNAHLRLSSVDIENGGAYSVVVTNLAGSDTSLAAALTVTHALRQGWVMPYNGPKSGKDAYTDVETDSGGHVFVTGYAETDNGKEDFLTAKYGPDGQLLWRELYNGPKGDEDRAVALALDQAGNLFVTGSSKTAGYEITTVMYGANGNRLWAKSYQGEPGQDAWAVDLTVDVAGNVYVAGTAKVDGHFGYAILKYDSNGARLWASRYAGLANAEDVASAIALDAGGNVYVTGQSKGSGTDFDYATVKYDSNGNLLWTARYNGSDNSTDAPADLVVDASGNAFVTGQSKGKGSGFDVVTIKYNPVGELLWMSRYDSIKHDRDEGTALTLDPDGNLIVVGASKSNNDFDYLTLKYSSAGTMLWQATYNGPGSGSDRAVALQTDADGNICVTGTSKGASTGFDFATVEYTPAGVTRWAARYNGSGKGDDLACALAFGTGNSMFVAGQARGANTDEDAVVIEYERPLPPVILTQPASQTVAVGAAVTFEAAAQGTAPLYWQWRLNEVPIPGATNATLLLSEVQASDSGRYQVVAWNAASAAKSATANLVVSAASLTWADHFAGRALTAALSGLGQGSNVGATREVGEPRHAGKTGAKSVWFSWRAPASGIATISTAGSDFDTVLAVYTGSSLAELAVVASDDDSGGFLTSKVVFNASAGTDYQIVVDGINGSSGNIVLSWGVEITADRLPVINSVSGGQTVGLGEAVTHTATVDDPTATYQWFRDGQVLAGAEQNALTISNVQPSDVGLYYVRVVANNREVLSQLVYLQINQSDGGVQRDAAALDKFGEVVALASGPGPSARRGSGRPIQLMSAPSRGYSGTQIFSTYAATGEEGEPSNCGIPGGASAWYAYQAPITGTLYVNTDGSDFDTTLGVYVGDGDSFESLVSLACDNDSGADGRTSAVRLPVTAGVTYYIAIDGVNGAGGLVVLNYNVGNPPVIVTQPVNQTVQPGGSTTLSVSVTGTEPCAYQWRFNGAPIPGATATTLSIVDAELADSGSYSVMVSNLINVTYSTEAQLTVRPPLLSIQGAVATWGSDRAVPNVTCQLSGTMNSSALSGVSGEYAVNVDPGGTYSVTPSRAIDMPPANGITTLDIALMRQRILGLATWDSPYKHLAADVNRSGTISTLDIALIRQIVLGITSAFPAGLWRFVPSEYVFPDAQNPWGAPGNLFYTALVGDIPGQDFVAIKLGDVNNSLAAPSGAGSTASGMKAVATQSTAEASPVRFELSFHTAHPGAVVRATVVVSGFRKVTTAQFAMAWDPAVLRYTGVGDFGVRGLSEGNFGGARIGDGILSVSWDDPETTGATLVDGGCLFTLSFEVVGGIGSTSPLAFVDQPTPREATVELTLAPVECRAGQVTVAAGKVLQNCNLDTTRGVFEVSVATSAGVRYTLEFSESLSAAPWVLVSTFAGDGTLKLLTIPVASSREGFYRLRSE